MHTFCRHTCVPYGNVICTRARRVDRSGRVGRGSTVFKDFLDWYSNDFYPLVLTDLIHSCGGCRKLAFYEPPSAHRSPRTMEGRVKFVGKKGRVRRIHYLDCGKPDTAGLFYAKQDVKCRMQMSGFEFHLKTRLDVGTGGRERVCEPPHPREDDFFRALCEIKRPVCFKSFLSYYLFRGSVKFDT